MVQYTETTPSEDSIEQEELNLCSNSELLNKLKALEADKAQAQQELSALKTQFDRIRAQSSLPAELSTTRNKPVWPFEVSEQPGDRQDTFHVVDESEAKRLYCVKYKLDPSLIQLKVRCLDIPGRSAAITKQYDAVGVDTTRIPGVNLGV